MRLFLQTSVILLRLLLVLGLTLAALLYLAQNRMMYFPRGYSRDAGTGLETLTWQTSDLAQFAYVLAPQTGDPATAPVTVIFGGNATRALDWLGRVPTAGRRGWYVLYEYPGYGRNGGSMSLARARESLDAFLPVLRQRFPDLGSRLRVTAHSLGCAAALEFARRQPVRELTLAAPFTSMLDMAQRTVGWPLCQVLTERWDNRAALAAVLAATPKPAVRVFHGGEDTLIPPRMGRELAEAHGLSFTLVERAGHDEVVSALRFE